MRELVEEVAAAGGLVVLGWREVPIDDSPLGPTARGVMPSFRQLFVAGANGETGLDLERLAFAARKVAERRAREHELSLYFCSLSARILVYKGMLTTDQLGAFFPDLRDDRFESAIALVHSRFSTNTFPAWPLAHPYRYIAHNGEFNTIRGNRNWMRTRETQLESELLGDMRRLFPICTPDASDSATFDEALELLHLGGRSLPHAVLMMIPEAWENHDTMDPGAARVLPVPRVPHRGVGRAGLRQLHRRHRDRRRPRPQRAAPRSVVADPRRAGRPRQRERRARVRPCRRRREGPAPARAGCSSSTPNAARSAPTTT